jgi:salicylate hydroxylase
MTVTRTVLIAGAGIGGLTAALAIAQRGFRVAVFDQAQQLDEVGAGIQLSPNASRILIALGLAGQLRRYVVAPEELRIMSARPARVLARAPLGATAEQRYGAPYWVIHRGDLQAVLLDAVRADSNITLHLGMRVEDFASHLNGVTISARSSHRSSEDRGTALIAADGLWSSLRQRLGIAASRACRHTAWRARPRRRGRTRVARAGGQSWFGRNAHLVHYPVRGGS